MPPWGLDPVKGYSYKYDQSLSDEQIQKITSWVEGGRPAGDPNLVGSLPPLVKSKIEHVDRILTMKESYKVKATSEKVDEYRCFPIGEAVDEEFVNLARWNFNFQREYHLQEPVLILPTEKIDLSCTWSNPGETDVFWGNDTRDEMCVSGMFVTDRS